MQQSVGMNKDIQLAAKQKLLQLGLSQTELAKRIRRSRPYVSRMLNSDEDWLPPAWSALLDELGLELIVVAKDADHG
jgi:transcriptional regulator with XRE-family HTH domain